MHFAGETPEQNAGGIRNGRAYGVESVENVEFVRSKRSSSEMKETRAAAAKHWTERVWYRHNHAGCRRRGKERRHQRVGGQGMVELMTRPTTRPVDLNWKGIEPGKL